MFKYNYYTILNTTQVRCSCWFYTLEAMCNFKFLVFAPDFGEIARCAMMSENVHLLLSRRQHIHTVLKGDNIYFCNVA